MKDNTIGFYPHKNPAPADLETELFFGTEVSTGGRSYPDSQHIWLRDEDNMAHIGRLTYHADGYASPYWQVYLPGISMARETYYTEAEAREAVLRLYRAEPEEFWCAMAAQLVSELK